MTHQTLTETHKAPRHHGLDAVRAFALLMGVFFHAAFSFFPGSEPVWMIMDTDRSTAIFVSAYVLHIFRMTTFFLLAGYFGRMLFVRLGTPAFIKDRLLRIIVPLTSFWGIILMAFGMLFMWIFTIQNTGATPEDLPPPPPLTVATFPLMHLWFLYLLVIFYAGLLLGRGLFSLLGIRDKLASIVDFCLARLIKTPLGILVLALPAALAFSLQRYWINWLGIQTPDIGLLPNTTALVAYGTAILFGWFLHRQNHLLDSIKSYWKVYLALAIALTVICLSMIGLTPKVSTVLTGNDKHVYAILYALAIWGWTFAFMGAAMQYLTRENKVIRYLADSSYWVYIIHLPIVVALQVYMHSWALPAAVKYVIILAVSLPIMLLSYHGLVRYTWIGKVLNGKKYPRKAEPAPIPQEIKE